MSARSLRRRLALPATLAVSITGAGAAVMACHTDEHPVPDAPVGTIPNRDAGVDAARPPDGLDGGPRDATPDAMPDAEPIG